MDESTTEVTRKYEEGRLTRTTLWCISYRENLQVCLFLYQKNLNIDKYWLCEMVSTLLCLLYQHSTTCCVFVALFSDMLTAAPQTLLCWTQAEHETLYVHLFIKKLNLVPTMLRLFSSWYLISRIYYHHNWVVIFVQRGFKDLLLIAVTQ